ncbi:MAG: type III polyketide synthase [Nocardioidaceae bacterium]
MSQIAAVHPVLPPFQYSQEEITERFAEACLPDRDKQALLRRVHSSAAVTTRHLAVPIEQYASFEHFGAANDAFIDAALELGSEALRGALKDAELDPADIDVIVWTSTTGLAVPSMDSRIAAHVGLRPDVERVPLFGLGCLAGAAGIARLHDLLRGAPGKIGALVSVELCSLTLQRDDPSTANLVASGLFGDGAAAVIMVADEGTPTRGPIVRGSRSHLYPDSQRAMGWDIGASGLKIVLGVEVPDLVSTYLADDVKGFLADFDLSKDDITAWVAHPGGPKVLQAVQRSLDLTRADLDVTWRSLQRIGNLSSASVLHVLRDTLDTRKPPPGSAGLLFAMGPGFSAELVLLRW